MEPRREFLMLAHKYNPDKHSIAGYYCSEKLDGIRCFWDGGLSRGLPTTSIPWASTVNPKTGAPKANIKEFATGLWSRYGNPIVAPDCWLQYLPACPLDGELWAGRGGFQTVTSVVRKNSPVEEEWDKIQYGVFGSPSIMAFIETGTIKNKSFLKTMEKDDILRWIRNRDRDLLEHYLFLDGQPYFAAELANLSEWVPVTSDRHFMVRQIKLPDFEPEAKEMVENWKLSIIADGGEGLVLRNPKGSWVPKRSHDVLKVKGHKDAEGTVTGFTSGRETELGSKLLGKIGALILDFNGKRLELSGLTNEEREFADNDMRDVASRHPGVDMPPTFQGKHFKLGDSVTFIYRELTDDGVPKEARYLRKRN